MLHHSQLAFYEQARCLFHKKIHLLWNGHLARLGTGKMPVLQENSSLLEWASCPKDACSTRKFISCGTGILPLLENGARCEMYRKKKVYA